MILPNAISCALQEIYAINNLDIRIMRDLGILQRMSGYDLVNRIRSCRLEADRLQDAADCLARILADGIHARTGKSVEDKTWMMGP